MYRIVSNEEELNQFQRKCSMTDVLSNEKVFKRLNADIECLNEAYGTDRDLQTDLGGYVVVIWGSQKEVQNEVERVLAYHKLHSDEFEYMDKIILPERNDITVTFRLFLCSSDYAVEIVTIEELNNETCRTDRTGGLVE